MLSFLAHYTPLKYFVQSFWRDEAFSYLLAKQDLLQIVVLTARDFNPPLYYILLHFWIQIAGASEIALRSFSLIFFWATIYVVFYILHHCFQLSSKKSFLYLLLFVGNPLLVYYGSEARMYSMLAFFATASYYFFLKKNTKAYLIVTVAGLYTHYFMLFMLLAQALVSFIEKKSWKPVALAGIGFVPWVIFLLTQPHAFAQQFWIPAISSKNMYELFGTIYTGYEPELDFLKFVFNGVHIFLLAVSIYIGGLLMWAWKRQKKTYPGDRYALTAFLLFAIPVVLIVIVSLVKPIYLPRYMIFSTIGLLLFLVLSLERMKFKTRIIFLVGLTVFTVYYQYVQIIFREKADIAITISDIKTLAQPGDRVYVQSDLDFFTVEYYFGEENVYIYHKKYSELPAYIGKILIPPEKLINTLPPYPHKAFILAPDGKSYTISSVR
ncbi:hypothetical protein HGA88_03280 [Candidatus Roizmanbacteria bacterium]|nr:hypothetical protein [Candidatus Roizmanbacteria bacterium]